MTLPDSNTVALCASIAAPLLWLVRVGYKILYEVKTISMIVRTCPNCQETVDAIDKANEHSL